jgi:Uma2 family endonuclease
MIHPVMRMTNPIPGLEGKVVVSEAEMRLEQFLAWADEDTHAEWVSGRVIPKMPASVRHQEYNGFLHLLMGSWVSFHQVGRVFHPPLVVRLTMPDGKQILREPDLIVVLNEHLDRLTEQYLDGAPDLVVEIVSAGRRATDRGEKFDEYEAAGVPEYWVIDPERKQAEFAQLNPQGVYQLVYSGSEGVYHSQVLPNFWLRVEWLWQQPPLPEILRAWGLI